MIKLFGHKHEWYYAKGESIGEISGNQRENCVRRICSKCRKKQYVEYYSNIIRDGLDVYYGGAVWSEGKAEQADEND